MDLKSQDKLQDLWLAKDYDGFARVLTRRIELHTKNALAHKLLVDRPTDDEDFAVADGGYYQYSAASFKRSEGLATIKPITMFMRPAFNLEEPLSLPKLLQVMQVMRIAMDRSFYMMIMHHASPKMILPSEEQAMSALNTVFGNRGTSLRTLIYGPQFHEVVDAEQDQEARPSLHRICLDWTDPTMKTFENGEFIGVAFQPRAALGAISRTEVVNDGIETPGMTVAPAEIKDMTPLDSDQKVPHLALSFTMKYRFCIHNMVHFVPGRVTGPEPA